MPFIRLILLIVILVVFVLVMLTLFVVITRRTQRKQKFKRLDKEREFYSPIIRRLLTDSPFDVTELKLKRKRNSAEWIVIEQELLLVWEDAPPDKKTKVYKCFEEIGYIDDYLRSLEHGNKWNRAAAAEKLGRVRCARAVEPLIKTLGDKDRDTRNMAANSLGLIGNPSAVGPLIELLRKATFDRAEASVRILQSALIKGFGTKAIPMLLNEYVHDDWQVRTHVIDILAEMAVPEVSNILVSALDDPERDVRAKAAKGLGNIGEPVALGRLIELTDDESWVVRLHSTRALGSIGDKSAIDTLKTRLTDTNWQVRSTAASALGKFGDAAYETLTDVLTSGGDMFGREQVLEELQRTGLLKSLMEGLTDMESQENKPALDLLKSAGKNGALRPIINALKHTDPRVRENAAKLLAGVGGERAKEALEGFVS